LRILERPFRIVLILIAVVLIMWISLAIQAYDYLGSKGLLCEFLALWVAYLYGSGRLYKPLSSTRFGNSIRKTCLRIAQAASLPHRTCVAKVQTEKTARLNPHLSFVSTILFLACFPFFVFPHFIGLVPGLLFILFFSYLFTGIAREVSLHNVLATLFLLLFVWLWGEAGHPGLIVMPVDLPQGRDDLNFTADGVANALETELKDFGANQLNYGGTQASKIFANELEDKLFPQSPWYKGTEARPPLLEGLQASHVIIGTDVEGFPLLGAYHILRHLRGMPLLEGQVLLGDDGSLTLALRRSNAPLNCMDEGLFDVILNSNPKRQGRQAVQELWELTAQRRTSFPNIADTRACNVSPIRRFLDFLDILHPPAAAEERLANVTVHNLQGDERLTTALHFASLQSMEHISPERLAIYYDNTQKYRSSLYFLKKAVPLLLSEAYSWSIDNPRYEVWVRQRFASALVRVGDFEGHCDEADKAYKLAAAVYP
jgi:hypothetical protein